VSDIGFATFASRRGSRFRMQLADGKEAALVLTDCSALSAGGSTDAFSLTFLAPADAPPEQSSYLISADGLDPRPIFLVPVARRADGLEYQAVFNRLPRPDPEEGTR
jgi:hypothetical protein